ncbi:hypothetical protein KY290_007818 [Solanum tuberosum]|uniref:Uncharacterized protein n=1 Tax=Solanum tuberosum TaxID=4113 RepID=A0ABQ7W6M2_SOLTU|nr:hypothetical protein KY290_007818 [Solanum tuberosum]
MGLGRVECTQDLTTTSWRTPVTSSSTVGDGDNDHQIWIVPEEDGFDPHKIVIEGIASWIRNYVQSLVTLDFVQGIGENNLYLIQ